jgi:hypothetical protein
MFDAAAENGLKAILEAVREHMPPHAMNALEETIRSYGKLCATNAVIEHLSRKSAA